MKRRVLPKLGRPQNMDAPERAYMRNLLIYQRAYHGLVRASFAELLPSLKGVVARETIDSLWDIRSYKNMRHLPGKSQVSETELKKTLDFLYSQKLYGHLRLGMIPDQKLLRFDSNVEEALKILFASVQGKLQSTFPDSLLRRWAEAMVGHVNGISKKNLDQAAKSAGLELNPLLLDGKLNPYFQNVIDENVGLIRSIPLGRQAALKNVLVHAISRDMSQAQIAELIAERFKAEKVNPRLIARDQVNKLNGKLNEYRQKQIGGKRYVWRTAGDERVRGNPGGLYPKARPSHYKLDGQTFFWSKPPVSGVNGERQNPGQPIQCRCYAEMVLDDIV